MACLSPYFRQVKGDWMPFPCGRCPPCKKRRVDGWVFRMLQEEKRSSSAHFITLTYDPAYLPISPNGHMTLDKKAFPDYMKRLRKLCYAWGVRYYADETLCTDLVPKLKYYACGEYGSEYSRPHYHAIVFNVPDDEMFYKAWSLDGNHLGMVHVGQVSADSIAYTVGYINKRQLTTPRRDDDRVPEFSLISKGIGSNYVTPSVKSYHTVDLSRNYLTKDGGSIIAMPRYYRDRIFDDDERSYQQGLAQIATGKRNSDLYADFLTRYSRLPGYTYDQYLESQRLGAVDAYYNNQKKRSQ